jgi:hypothetical protein
MHLYMHLSYDGRLNLPTFRDIGSLNLILQTVNLYLQSRGVRITTGTIVDATIIRETRIGLVNENFVIRKQLLADYRAGIGPKPFEFVRRPDEERGALGMHYTSVPNILKVLNPLFLDDLHTRLEEAGDNPRTLLNLRKRIAKIRVFDPACGSGNFLVIAYKEMLAIESEINKRRGEPDLRREIPLTSFRGI